MEVGPLRPPSVMFDGRLWHADEMAALAAGWLDVIREAIPPVATLTALPLGNHPDAIALFFALTTLPLPVVVLSTDARAWRSSPPIPPPTPLFLPPSLHGLAAAADALGLTAFALPPPRPASASPAVAFMATPGVVNFTSGSTGRPKPVYIATQSFLRQTAAVIQACGLGADADVAASLPLATHYGLGQALFLPTVLGSRLGLIERFDHRSLLRLFTGGRYRYWAGTPVMANMLSRAPLPVPRPPAPEICHISAGRLSERVFRDFLDRFGVPLRPNYGQTENGFITVDAGPAEDIRPGSVGCAAPGIEVRIGDDPRAPFRPGRPGRVWFTSPWYMEGYGFPPRLADRDGRGGWWPTHDLGHLDERGRLTLAGRADDCFKTAAGYLVGPGEVTDALLTHPHVVDAAVMSVTSALGPVVGAVVEASPGVRPAEVRDVAARALPPWLCPDVVIVVERLPRLEGGKVDRLACRKLLGA